MGLHFTVSTSAKDVMFLSLSVSVWTGYLKILHWLGWNVTQGCNLGLYWTDYIFGDIVQRMPSGNPKTPQNGVYIKLDGRKPLWERLCCLGSGGLRSPSACSLSCVTCLLSYIKYSSLLRASVMTGTTMVWQFAGSSCHVQFRVVCISNQSILIV